MLSQRLDKLETDLTVLNSMHDLLLQFQTDEVDSDFDAELLIPHLPPRISDDDLPERDADGAKSKLRNKGTSGKSIAPPKKKRIENKSNASSRKNFIGGQINDEDNANPTIAHMTDAENTTEKSAEDLEKERQILKEDVEKERSLRAEVEESAKHVYIKLQKVEDELEREKKTKESLLLGTLQMKNLVHGYDTKIKELNVNLTTSKTEKQFLSSEVKELSSENGKILKRLRCLCNELGYQNGHNKNDNGPTSLEESRERDCIPYIEFLRSKIQSLSNKFANEESDKVCKLTSDLNETLGRCEKFEKELVEASKELQQCKDREECLKQQLQTSQISLSTAESELLKKQIEYECTIKKLSSDSEIEKGNAAIKISEYSSVIRRTKELLVMLRNERDASRRDLLNVSVEHRALVGNLKELESEKCNMTIELQKLSRRIKELTTEKIEAVEESNKEKFKLESSLQKMSLERRKCIELLSQMKHQLVSVKNKYKHEVVMLQIEQKKLLTENKRLDENFRVIQKVSEDQGQTIQKLRGDLENLKNCNFKLDTQARDHQYTENQLVTKLEQCEKKLESHVRHIESLEEQLEKYSEDVRTHDCDDYADSRYKRKLIEMEDAFRLKNKEWEATVREVENERDEALQTAKKTMQKIDELREYQNSQLAQTKSQFEGEMTKLVEQHSKQELEKQNKIHELQSELDRIRLSSSQTQRALSTKIQQLQAALNICIGGSNQNNNSSWGLGLLHQLHYHHPVAAFGNGGSVNNNGCANNTGASSVANLLFNSVPGGGGGGSAPPQTQTTCFGNPNVNGCTSGILGEPYHHPTTGSFGGCMDNLI